MTASGEDVVLLDYTDDRRIATVTLNRPRASNALNSEMAVALVSVLDTVAAEPACRVMILTGAGERAFCAGADLKERSGMTLTQWSHQHHRFERAATALRDCTRPIFAAVNGAAMGGGLELAMSTDFILCADTAVFGQPEVARGLHPGLGGTQLLPRLLPPGRARQMLFTGETLSAAEAVVCGLANSTHSPGELRHAALDVAERIAGNSPLGVQQAKAAARLGADCSLERGIEIELLSYERVMEGGDRIEGAVAFEERRSPVFGDVAQVRPETVTR